MGSALFYLFFALALPSGELDDLPLLSGGIRRLSSFDSTDGNNDFFEVHPGQSLVLADIKGSGTIKRIYIKVDSNDPAHLRNMVLRFFWEDNKAPGVDCPLGDFFAQGHAKYAPVDSAPLVTGNRRGLTCYFPMPFRKHALLLLQNEGRGSRNRVTYQIDYEPGEPKEGAGLFHAAYNQGVENVGDNNYLVLHAEGRGKYVGLVVSMVLGEDGWFGEGDERIYVDDEKTPAVQGTGLDDLFGCAWGFQKGFSSRYSGTPVAGDLTAGSEFVGYRFLFRDPVTFQKSIDVYLEHVGDRFLESSFMGDGMSRHDEFYTVAYWYQDKPSEKFVRMPTADLRISGDRRFTAEGELLPLASDSYQQVAPRRVDGVKVTRFTPKGVGDEVVFTIHCSATGWYDLSGFFTRSALHGIYRVRLAGEILGLPLDFYTGEGGQGRYFTRRSDEMFLGSVYLPAGSHSLGFEAMEPNPNAAGMLLDIDALIFRPIPAPKEE
ncbi:MAG: DUF2961 domain-containing protein [Planctomycetes bacterium]|nr:DUF2961 domain-containing protein [Planctomycetota bacterium]